MLNSLLGTKLHMTQMFDPKGKRWAATAIQAGPCTIAQVKTKDKDGYQAVQISFNSRKRVNQPIAGHLKKAGISDAVKYLREVKPDDLAGLEPGQSFTVSDVFQPGDVVRVMGISKGKGFAGVMKRWKFGGGPRTHGQSDRKRAPGSIGAGTTPGRVVKGKKMAGRMGGDQVTVAGLTVLDIDPETHTLLVSGPVPGANKGLLVITKTGHNDKYTGLHQEKEEKAEDKETSEAKNKPEPSSSEDHSQDEPVSNSEESESANNGAESKKG